jgi:hypothetical protein
LSSALGLKAPLASPSFTGVVVSAGDVSLNAGLSVASDSSFNNNLFISGKMAVSGDVSLNGNVFIQNMYYNPSTVSTTTFNATYPLNSIYIVTFNGAVTFNLPALPAGVTSGIITIRKIGSVASGVDSTITLTPPTSIIYAAGATSVSANAAVCAVAQTSVQLFFSNGNYYVL